MVRTYPHTPTIRLVIQQPALPKYRLPVFRELARRPGIDLRIFYGETPGLSNIDATDLATHHAPMKSLRIGGQELFWHAPQLRYATRAATDVLILSWSTRYASLVPALLRARKNGVPTILWGHGYSKREAAWRAWPREKIAGLATALMFYNHTAANAYRDRGWDPQRLFVALNALDQTPIQAARKHWLDRPDDLARFRREHGLGGASGGPTILFVSRFEPANRIDLLIRASAVLRQRHPGLQTIIIGKGEPEETRLKQLTASLGLTDCVRFPGAIYDEMHLAPWFLSANAFCYPANIGLSLLHAFGYGLPTVTSDRTESQNPEIEALRPDDNGLLYRHDDPMSLAETLDRLLSDPALAARMSGAAHRTATERFTLGNMVNGMEAAVRYCAANGTVNPVED